MRNFSFLENLLPSDITACNRARSFLQSGFWGSFKARFGWNARSFTAQWKGGESCSVLVIRRRLAPGVSFAYVPWGPELPSGFLEDGDGRTAALAELASSLRDFLPKDTAFARFDPPWFSEGADTPPPSLSKPFLRAGVDIQAPDTVLIDLEKSEEELFSAMKSKWRYNSRLALKKGVKVTRADEAGLESFYALLRETAKRDGIAVHSVEYYKTLFSHLRDYGAGGGIDADLRLYLAEHEGETLAAIMVLFWGREAVYLYGASSNRKRNLMAPYALQVEAMLDAKKAGRGEYDLFGIPPREDPSHPMAGLYRFKTGFGGKIIHRPGSWDYIYRPLSARLFRTAESARKKFRDLKKAKAKKNGSDE